MKSLCFKWIDQTMAKIRPWQIVSLSHVLAKVCAKSCAFVSPDTSSYLSCIGDSNLLLTPVRWRYFSVQWKIGRFKSQICFLWEALASAGGWSLAGPSRKLTCSHHCFLSRTRVKWALLWREAVCA